jgi:Ser/Thr protein kinase RdoA (MazF antagonist)
MFSADLIRKPAWSGLAPALPEPVEISAAEAEEVLRAFGLSGQLTGLRLGGGNVEHYRLQPPSGPPLFLKLVGPGQRDIAKRAEALARWLAGKGLAVSAQLDGFPRRTSDGQMALAAPFIEGRRIRADEHDLRLLGETIAGLHLLLASHPDRPAWKLATRARLDTLTNVRADLSSGSLRCGPEPNRLRELAADMTAEFDLGSVETAALHGDLNSGNVLVDVASGRHVLLDFEDVLHSVLPPIFELLLVIERFVLVPIEDDETALTRSHALLDAYRRSGGRQLSAHGRAPAAVLRGLALRSLCVLAYGEAAGIGTPDDEWRKFLVLEERARQRAPLIARIIGDDA